jgi:LmbE family N-acetylglucosaminyl deacetylase
MKPHSHNILVVAAHPDDEVLGAGGTIAQHVTRDGAVYVAILAEGASVQFPDAPEMIAVKQSQALKAAEVLGVKDVFFGNFPDQQLDTHPFMQITGFIEELVRKIHPNVVYTHHFSELNRDHRVAYEATSVAVRPFSCAFLERFLCFMVDTVGHWGQGVAQYNVFSDISATLEAKLQAMQAYETEVRTYPHPRSLEALRHMAYRNGAMVGLPAAEMFQLVVEVHR